MQNGRFPCKSALHLKKVCYKVSLCELWTLPATKLYRIHWPI